MNDYFVGTELKAITIECEGLEKFITKARQYQ